MDETTKKIAIDSARVAAALAAANADPVARDALARAREMARKLPNRPRVKKASPNNFSPNNFVSLSLKFNNATNATENMIKKLRNGKHFGSFHWPATPRTVRNTVFGRPLHHNTKIFSTGKRYVISKQTWINHAQEVKQAHQEQLQASTNMIDEIDRQMERVTGGAGPSAGPMELTNADMRAAIRAQGVIIRNNLSGNELRSNFEAIVMGR